MHQADRGGGVVDRLGQEGGTLSAEACQRLKDVAVGFAGGSRHLQFFEIKQGKSSESGLAAGFFPIGSGKVGFSISIYMPSRLYCHMPPVATSVSQLGQKVRLRMEALFRPERSTICLSS